MFPLVCKIPLLARRTRPKGRPSAARDDRVSCIQCFPYFEDTTYLSFTWDCSTSVFDPLACVREADSASSTSTLSVVVDNFFFRTSTFFMRWSRYICSSLKFLSVVFCIYNIFLIDLSNRKIIIEDSFLPETIRWTKSHSSASERIIRNELQTMMVELSIIKSCCS